MASPIKYQRSAAPSEQPSLLLQQASALKAIRDESKLLLSF